ncbi:cupin domain-containing protein [Phenylobacterium sp. J367]|uniref:cupin domain-containing protein n=1 Tax=Phenylobacterium sp. J367 TaxID=2898435 RepID=UPI002151326D|nr:cupin domain-containing protein [Phenylobacterium sp. J367]MCR5878887.1 cupin domain-containing protein [Phenylobacterium sp. J367]
MTEAEPSASVNAAQSNGGCRASCGRAFLAHERRPAYHRRPRPRERHPEGGWYRETWRAPAPGGGRAAGTSILFLLEAGGRSHWHRVDAAELWIFQAGTPLILGTSMGQGVAETRLGPDPLAGDVQQHVVQPGEWQAARAGDGWALVACVVVPGFEFSGFELAPPGWAPAP